MENREPGHHVETGGGQIKIPAHPDHIRVGKIGRQNRIGVSFFCFHAIAPGKRYLKTPVVLMDLLDQDKGSWDQDFPHFFGQD
jgi:hypothetical protein